MYSSFAARCTLERVAPHQNWTSALWEMCPAILSRRPTFSLPTIPASLPAPSLAVAVRMRTFYIAGAEVPVRSSGFRQEDNQESANPVHLRRSLRLSVTMAACAGGPGSWSENILKYFLRNNQITAEDGAEILWSHAANHKSQMNEALKSAAHMIEADVLLPSDGSEHGQPIMAHPPETSSDNTLQEWLAEVVKSNKGIKLDFKSLAAVRASMLFLDNVKQHLQRPVWINADILPGPNGSSKVVDAKAFLDTVTSFFPDVTFSLGWTTGWHPEKVNEGYSWSMVKEMDYICSELTQPVTFPVRAALVRQSCSQLLWLLTKSNRYSLTVWTGKDDIYSTEDLLYIRDYFNKTQVFYDISEPQNHEFKQAIGIRVHSLRI